MSQPSGWYDDPRNPDLLRYWDGVLWTEHTTSKRSATPEPSPGPPADAPAYRPQASQSPPPGWGGYPGHSPSYPPAQQGYDRPPPGFGYGAAPQVAWHTGGPTAPDGARLADWWQRLVARIIDALVVGILVAVVGFPWLNGILNTMTDFMADVIREAESGSAAQLDQTAFQEQLMQYVLPLTLVTVAVGVVYETFFLVRSGATPGKKVLGISVRRVNRPGPLTVVEALKRQVIQQGCNLLSLVPVGSIIALFLQPLDVLWLLWDPRRQALHDKVADTLVVRVPKLR